MTNSPNHWIATDPGNVRELNEDAYVWLGPAETGNNGYLWVIVDGEGGHGVGDLAAGMLAITVGEVYADLLDLHGDPVAALEIVADEANQRLEAIAAVYPALEGLRASFAAVALFESKLYAVSAGNARVYRVRDGEIERLGEDQIENTRRSEADPDPVPKTGLRASGALLTPLGDPVPASDVVYLLCTDGIADVVPDELTAEALQRLQPRDAVEVLIELSKQRWSDDNATAAVVRFGELNLESATAPPSFLHWAASGMTQWPDGTLVLQAIVEGHDGPPARASVERLPPISGEPRASMAEVEDLRERTMSFSPEQVALILGASTVRTEPGNVGAGGSGAPAQRGDEPDEPDVEVPTPAPGADDSAGADDAKPATPGGATSGTMAFSPQQLEQVRDLTARPIATSESADVPAADPVSSLPFAHTVGLSASDSAAAVAHDRGEVDPDGDTETMGTGAPTPPPPTSEPPAAATEPSAPLTTGKPTGDVESTMFFSPQQMDELRKGTGAKPNPKPPIASQTAELAPSGTIVFTPRTDELESQERAPSELASVRDGQTSAEELATMQSPKLDYDPQSGRKALIVFFATLGVLGLAAAWWFALGPGA